MTEAWESAVVRGDVESIQSLLRAGENVDARDRHGQTALMLAAHRGDQALVEALVAAGADLNATAKHNLTALMLAIVAGHEEAARRLARAGTDPGVKGSGAPGFLDKTAYDLAADRGMRDLCADLEGKAR